MLHRNWIAWIIFVAVSGGVGYYLGAQQVDLQLVLAVLHLGTFLAVAFYTYLTSDLARSAAITAQSATRQEADQWRPLVRAVADSSENGFVLTNIGRGPAMNVHVGETSFNPAVDGKEIEYEFSQVDVLEPGERTLTTLRAASRGLEPFLFAHFTEYSNDDHSVHVEYEDIHGRPCRSIAEAGRRGTRLKAFLIEGP